MSRPITGTDAWVDSYVIPDDASPPTAAATNVGLEALGDRTRYLYERRLELFSTAGATLVGIAAISTANFILDQGKVRDHLVGLANYLSTVWSQVTALGTRGGVNGVAATGADGRLAAADRPYPKFSRVSAIGGLPTLYVMADTTAEWFIIDRAVVVSAPTLSTIHVYAPTADADARVLRISRRTSFLNLSESSNIVYPQNVALYDANGDVNSTLIFDNTLDGTGYHGAYAELLWDTTVTPAQWMVYRTYNATFRAE